MEAGFGAGLTDSRDHPINPQISQCVCSDMETHREDFPPTSPNFIWYSTELVYLLSEMSLRRVKAQHCSAFMSSGLEFSVFLVSLWKINEWGLFKPIDHFVGFVGNYRRGLDRQRWEFLLVSPVGYIPLYCTALVFWGKYQKQNEKYLFKNLTPEAFQHCECNKLCYGNGT